LKTALVIVDMQRYYLDSGSDYFKFFTRNDADALSYIKERCLKVVIPNIKKLLPLFRKCHSPIIFLRLTGRKIDRSDLHRSFRATNEEGKRIGLENVYPLREDPMAAVVRDIYPVEKDMVFDKTTFSPFNSTGILKYIKEEGITRLAFTGLATSQCVDTTSRDASDHGFEVIHIEDAEADYTEEFHLASLYASRGVCGGNVVNTKEFMELLNSI